MYKKLGDVYKVKQVLGHSSIRVTEEYLRGFEDDSLDDDYESLF